MSTKLELEILEEIDAAMMKLNEKLTQLLSLELWLMNLREETMGKKNILVV